MNSRYDIYGVDITIPLFGERLYRALKLRNMSQAELARRCGYASRRIITEYVNDRRYPSIGHLYKMCEILNVSSDYLLGLKEEI